MAEARDKAQPLAERYGKENVQRVADVIARIDQPTNTLPLTDDVCALCFHFLGPPPEHEWIELWKKPDRLPLPVGERAGVEGTGTRGSEEADRDEGWVEVSWLRQASCSSHGALFHLGSAVATTSGPVSERIHVPGQSSVR